VAQQASAGNRGDVLAVVASASPEDRRHLEQSLGHGGYATRIVVPGASLVDEVLATTPDVVFRPVNATELLHRTGAAIARRRRDGVQRASSARLREDMRRISARIRATNDPAVMVEQFLSGVGRALGAHHTVLQVFEDERVAARSSTWTDGTDADRLPIAAPLRVHQDASLPLALTLWEDTATASFSTADDAGPDARRAAAIPIPAWLRERGGVHRAVNGVVVALGEGDTPFGLLWIISEETPLRWSGVEGALTQHVLGNLAHGLIQAQLISRQQQAVRKLRALNQAKSDFVGTVNHELRTPLASIAGYLEMINDGVGGELPPEASTMLQAVERNTAKLSQLIENISALSSTEADVTEHGPVDIVHLVSELTARAAPQARSGGITLHCTVPEDPVTVSGDREQLSAALAVVLSNALKYTQEDGTVSVGLTQEPDHGHAIVVVQDTGIGIPADDLPRLFESFHRASNANQAVPGAGVGLSIAKRTFEAHHGSITIESSLGVGTIVAITLPLLNHAAVG